MVGLNRTTIIAPEWERHHRPVAVSTMTGLCRVIRPGQPGGYPDFEPGPDVVLVETVCRVQQQQNRAARGDSQGQLVDSRDYLVTIPAEKWPEALGYLKDFEDGIVPSFIDEGSGGEEEGGEDESLV